MIKKEEVKHIAELARIGLTDEEMEKYSQELSGILAWIDQLKEVDISGVEPTEHITGVKNVSRQDISHPFENREKIINLFPEEKNGYNKVKAVL